MCICCLACLIFILFYYVKAINLIWYVLFSFAGVFVCLFWPSCLKFCLFNHYFPMLDVAQAGFKLNIHLRMTLKPKSFCSTSKLLTPEYAQICLMENPF